MKATTVMTIILLAGLAVGMYYLWTGFNNINDLVMTDVDSFNGKA
jgi:hypothetical protein